MRKGFSLVEVLLALAIGGLSLDGGKFTFGDYLPGMGEPSSHPRCF